MTDRKKLNPINIKLPDRSIQSREIHSREKERLTDPPLLRKGQPKVISSKQQNIDKFGKLVDIFEKTQTEFGLIYKQILAMNQRQENMNNIMMEHMQHAQTSKVASNQASSALKAEKTPGGASIDDLEARYRYFLVDPPSETHRVDMDRLKHWLNKVFSQTFSVAFHRFSNKEMTFQQAKIFCSSNILRNLIILNDKVSLTTTQLKSLEEQMNQLLRYLQLKYPLTESAQVNKNLEAALQQVDNMGLLAHNYFANSQLVFTWRESGNYNDLIMRMLNDVLGKIDQKSPFEKGSNFADFKQFMTILFKSVEQEDMSDSSSVQETPPVLPGALDFITDRYVKMKSSVRNGVANTPSMKSSSKIRQQKQKYKARVQQYTNFLISRKVTENTPKYTSKQIESNNLIIKSPAVLRILTKWAEQLRHKFTAEDYYTNLSDNIKSQSNGVHSLLFPLRRILDEQINKEEIEIRKFLKQMSWDNLHHQLKLFNKEINKASQPFDHFELEQISGRFSIQVLQSLHSNLIAYLNRLIHGLTSVAKRLYHRCKLNESSQWTSPPDLVTFTIGDLLRCKISSKQRQILKVYDQLKQLSIHMPQKLKIIRVKNRLSKSTNDVLVNVKFNNHITAQIQLAVKSEVSEFTKCSNLFCHYLYELERSPFGPIAELCNTWAALDRTSQSFKERIARQAARQTPLRHHRCNLNQFQPFSRPFICYSCEVVYNHNNYLRSHSQCQQCKQVICAKCLLRNENPLELKSQLILNKKLRASCTTLVDRIDTSAQVKQEELPQFGVCISIQRQSPEVEPFRLVRHGIQRFLFGKAAGKIYQIEKIQSKHQLANFMRSCLIFALNPEEAAQYVKISPEQALQTFILPQELTEVYQKQRQSLVIGDNLSNEVLQKALQSGYPQGKDKIRKIFLDSNRINSVDFITWQFRNVILLELSYNPISSLDGLERLHYLKSVSLTGCQLKILPQSLFSVRTLQQLRLSRNELTSIAGIRSLDRLKLLDLSHNHLSSLPAQLSQCIEMIVLRLECNLLETLPTTIENLKQLRQLYLSSNGLKELPKEIGGLILLQVLDAKNNALNSVPDEIGGAGCLERLDLSRNNIDKLPESIGRLVALNELDVSKNKELKNLPASVSKLVELSVLNLNNCSFTSIVQQILTIKSLQHIQLSSNKLTFVPALDQLPSLLSLDLSHNLLQTDNLRHSFNHLPSLHTIQLHHNQLLQIPSFNNCQHLSVIDVSNNLISYISQQEIGGLDCLTRLDLSHNRLEDIPEGIMALPKLKELNLAANQLRRLADGIMTIWPNLLKIDISQNLLQQLPSCLLRGQQAGESSRLAEINVSNNRIEKLPKQLTQLHNLKKFKYDKNSAMKITGELERFMKDKGIEADGQESKVVDSPKMRVRPMSRNMEHRRSFKQ